MARTWRRWPTDDHYGERKLLLWRVLRPRREERCSARRNELLLFRTGHKRHKHAKPPCRGWGRYPRMWRAVDGEHKILDQYTLSRSTVAAASEYMSVSFPEGRLCHKAIRLIVNSGKCKALDPVRYRRSWNV